MRTLVVDDSKTMRTILCDIMQEAGFATYEAADGQDGLKRLEELGTVEVALVDWTMPVMTGIQFVQAVRQNSAYSDMLIMMVTANTEMAHVVQSLESGANEYVMKPFTKEAILEKLVILGLMP